MILEILFGAIYFLTIMAVLVAMAALWDDDNHDEPKDWFP